MKKISSIIVIAACLSMIGSLFTPQWDITLDAPEYPEGLNMQIWLNQISGEVATISGLNHYIGMKPISASMFPEFSYMKTVVIVVIISGIIVSLLRKKWLYSAWFVAFLAVAALGIYDFWSWEYDYGHNLNPHAAIIVPGMSYQPPLIGCKQLLNFNACSFPATGGIIIMIAGTVCFLVFGYELVFNRKPVAQKIKTSSAKLASIHI